MKTDKNTDNQNTKRRSTFAILFYINRTKVRKDGMCQLLCKVSIDAEWEQIGTKVSVNPAIWNPEKGRADGRSENAVTVNRAIDELTKEITGHYNHIKKSLGFVTAELVKNAVKGIGQKPVTLLALFREHNEEFKKRVDDALYAAYATNGYPRASTDWLAGSFGIGVHWTTWSTDQDGEKNSFDEAVEAFEAEALCNVAHHLGSHDSLNDILLSIKLTEL